MAERCRLDVCRGTQSRLRIHVGGGGSVCRTVSRQGWREASPRGWVHGVSGAANLRHPQASEVALRSSAPMSMTPSTAINSPDTVRQSEPVAHREVQHSEHHARPAKPAAPGKRPRGQQRKCIEAARVAANRLGQQLPGEVCETHTLTGISVREQHVRTEPAEMRHAVERDRERAAPGVVDFRRWRAADRSSACTAGRKLRCRAESCGDNFRRRRTAAAGPATSGSS